MMVVETQTGSASLWRLHADLFLLVVCGGLSCAVEPLAKEPGCPLRISRLLEKGVDYTILEKEKTVTLTEPGEQKACDELHLDDLFNPQETREDPKS